MLLSRLLLCTSITYSRSCCEKVQPYLVNPVKLCSHRNEHVSQKAQSRVYFHSGGSSSPDLLIHYDQAPVGFLFGRMSGEDYVPQQPNTYNHPIARPPFAFSIASCYADSGGCIYMFWFNSFTLLYVFPLVLFLCFE